MQIIENNLRKVSTKSANCAAQVTHSSNIQIKQTYPLAKSPGHRGKIAFNKNKEKTKRHRCGHHMLKSK